MIELVLIGIGTGNPEHLTLEAVAALKSADVVLIPKKEEGKGQLAQVRRDIVNRHATKACVQTIEFDMPARRGSRSDYRAHVEEWHHRVAEAWKQAIGTAISTLGSEGSVALLIWGDPSLYDSSLRISGRLAKEFPLRVRVIPGLTSIQVLAASHRIPVNEIGESVLITTGRNLAATGWPAGASTVLVMLDGELAFTAIEPEGVTIWWGAYLGLPQELTLTGPLKDVRARIVELRAAARSRHGWIMDVYLLRR
jgi:precorrin-6A synthase